VEYIDHHRHPSGKADDEIHTLRDITNARDLIRYAVQVQLHLIGRTAADIASRNPRDHQGLSRCLAGDEEFTQGTLRQLDTLITAISGSMPPDSAPTHVGGLAPFAARIGQDTGHAPTWVEIPPRWVRDALETRSHDEIHVLAQASALLNTFRSVQQDGGSTEVLLARNAAAIQRVAEQLILLAGGPPTARHYEAQALLGSLAMHAFDTVLTELVASITNQPLGFRSWRSLTKLVATVARTNQTHLEDKLKRKLVPLLNDVAELRNASINPGRSLDLEFFIAVPWGWAGESADGERINRLLLGRAEDKTATLRERGMAAMGLWQRAMANERVSDVRDEVLKLIRLFDAPAQRKDLKHGFNWVARNLEYVMRQSIAVCNDFPAVEDPWYGAVEDTIENAPELTGLPTSIRIGTQRLVRHALLQNAGVLRRTAIDTLRSGGLVEEVSHVLVRLLHQRTEPEDAWLRVRALFALGFMQPRDVVTEGNLTAACANAFVRVARGDATGSEIVELQTALFALGDVYGVTGAEDQSFVEAAGRVRNKLRIRIEDFVNSALCNDPHYSSVSRALVYLLAFTAQPGTGDLSHRLLKQLLGHSDKVTRDFSDWAQFRFADDRVRPLLYAIE